MLKWLSKNMDRNLFIMIIIYLSFLIAFIMMWPNYEKAKESVEAINELQLRLETEGPYAPPPPATPKGMNGPMECKAALH